MVEIEVRTASRKLRRDMNKAMQRSYLKALTEPITNSDDSYRKLEEVAFKKGNHEVAESKKQILIYVNRERKEFQVVDFAEGLSKSDMEDLFSEYGEEKRSHFEKGRGLFGQGLLDLLFSRTYGGYVNSFKAGKYSFAEFKWKKKKERGKVVERRVIKLPDTPLKDTREHRERFHIPNGNGTCVNFKFTEAKFPSEEEILERLANFYMLRFINSDPKREVKVIFLTKEGGVKSEHKLNYVFPEGERIDELTTTMTYKPFSPIKIEAVIYKSEYPLPQAEAGDDREGGLLVYDEHYHVLDLTLFGYDDNPYAANFFGKLKLTGAYEIIREKLRENEEILSESRDGFVKSHHFYIKLKQIIDKWLRPIIEEEKTKEEATKSNLSDSTVRRHREAFKKLNELYENLNKEIKNLGEDPGVGQRRPENGIEFDRKNTTIEEKKDYSIRLRVDVDIIPSGSIIDIISDNDTILARPAKITVDETYVKDNIFSQAVLLCGGEKDQIGIVKAETQGRFSEVQVIVVEEALWSTSEGLEFNPSSYHSEPGKRKSVNLYADISKIPVGSLIRLESTNENIVLELSEIKIKDDQVQKNGMAKIDIYYVGSGIGQKGKIIATYDDYRADAFVEIRPKRAKNISGIFTDWDYQPLDTSLQTWHDPDTGIITINSNHPINRTYFGKSKDDAQISVELYPHCQILLAELIISQCIAAAVHPAYLKNILDIRFPGDPFTDVYRYIQDEKRNIGKEIFDLFVKKSAINKMKELYPEKAV